MILDFTSYSTAKVRKNNDSSDNLPIGQAGFKSSDESVGVIF